MHIVLIINVTMGATLDCFRELEYGSQHGLVSTFALASVQLKVSLISCLDSLLYFSTSKDTQTTDTNEVLV